MARNYFFLFLITLSFSCTDDSIDLSGNKPVKPEDFVKAFKVLATPNRIADTSLNNLGDTLSISLAVLSQLIPDSSLSKLLGKNNKSYKINPVGKIEKEAKEKYLLVKFSNNKKIKLVAFVLSADNKYLCYLDLLSNANNDKYAHYVSVTGEPTFIISREKTISGNLFYTKNGLAFNESTGTFTAVVNDTNEDLAKANEIINPIDTLPRKNKYSGDYAADSRNFISLRDGKDQNTYLFFLNFDKNSGACAGELKAEMSISSTGTGVYHENGDPCTINFNFSKNSIHLQEAGNCGNYRGINCLIDYTYPRKKDKKVASKK